MQRCGPITLGLMTAIATGWPGAINAQEYQPIAPVASPPDRPRPDGEPISLSLNDAIMLSLRDNRTIKSAYLERINQKFSLRVARNQFDPQLNLTANIQHRQIAGRPTLNSVVTPQLSWRSPIGTQVGFAWSRHGHLRPGPGGQRQSTTLSIRQPLLRGGGSAVTLAPLRSARLQEQINRLDLSQTVASTVSAVIFAYRNLLQAQRQVELAELSFARLEDLLATNRQLIAAGRLAAADIVQAQSRLANQQVAVLQAKQQLATTQLGLLQLLAINPRTNVIAADHISADHVDIDVEQAIALGLESRRDIMAQRIALEQSQLAYRVAQNNRLWDVTLEADIASERGHGGLAAIEPQTNATFGLSLSIPFNDLSSRQGEIQAATNLTIAELRFEELQQSVITQVSDAVQAVEANWQQLVSARRATQLTHDALEIQRQRLAVGRASNFEVLSFQADLQAADRQELLAEISYLNALTAFDQQIGGTLTTWRITLDD